MVTTSSKKAVGTETGKNIPRKEASMQVARRQAARLLQKILKEDESRHATASIKSLIYQPSIRNKKATMALICQTLKYLPIIKEVLESSDLLKNKKKIHVELLYVTTFELLFGKEFLASGIVEEFVLSRKNTLRTALARLLVKKNVQRVEDLLPDTEEASNKVRFLRVNTLKMEVERVIESLGKSFKVEQDDDVPGLICLPAGVDLHKHPLVANGSLILQGKSSCIPAVALAPEPNWVVLDACAAPGNKTIQLAALMHGKGTVIACELNDQRVKRLREAVQIAGASSVRVWHQDFLKLDISNPLLSQVKAILLDPSCSGSGTIHRRLDHLLPSSAKNESVDTHRLEKLAQFQEKALRFALSFPSVERVVYSTCSVHQQENEDVVKAVLQYAYANGFKLGKPVPQWAHRGLPIFDGAENLLRVEPSEEMDGFFVALFERKLQTNLVEEVKSNKSFKKGKKRKRKCKTNKVSQSTS